MHFVLHVTNVFYCFELTIYETSEQWECICIVLSDASNKMLSCLIIGMHIAKYVASLCVAYHFKVCEYNKKYLGPSLLESSAKILTSGHAILRGKVIKSHKFIESYSRN